ncbi:hypothetical protein [Actinomadura keratinilytica]|uniref:Uncharacterized protein n=1 Tax=Actinomadura keratinilytica TaxID=547461 RepID=A0ABP7ZHP4_9ACTN
MAARRPLDPPPTSVEVERIVEEVHRRRLAEHDDDLHLWSDAPADVITYVLEHRRVPRRVQVADARAALRLIRAQRARLDELELRALDICRQDGDQQVPWSALARDLGVATPQAADQRRDRLRAAVADRARRTEESADAEHAERAWTLRNGARIRTAAAALVRAFNDIAATGNGEAVDIMEDIEVALDGYQATHRQHAALVYYFGMLGRALGEKAADLPAVRTAVTLYREFDAVTASDDVA